VLAWIKVDHATALKATYKAGRRGGDSIARTATSSGCGRSLLEQKRVKINIFI